MLLAYEAMATLYLYRLPRSSHHPQGSPRQASRSGRHRSIVVVASIVENVEQDCGELLTVPHIL